MGCGFKETKYISVASYNVHRCIGRDRCCAPSRIAEIIKELNATIVGLQEVDSNFNGNINAAGHLSAMLGLEAVPGPSMVRQNGHYGNLLLTSHPIASVRKIDLSVQGREPRSALDVALDVEGRTVRVILTHFGLKSSERRAQIERLRESVVIDPDQLTIFMGDFNEWLLWTRRLGSLRSHSGNSGFLRTFPSRFPFFPLDRVFVWPKEAFLGAEVVSTPLSRTASDHLPIRAFIKIS